jgi:glutathione S-transferase
MSNHPKSLTLYAATGACGLHVQIVLREAGLPFHLELVDLKTKLTASGTDFNQITAKSYIPALKLTDGEVLTEGAVITQWIADQVPEQGLLPAPGTIERTRAQVWLHFIATEIHKTFSPLFKPSSEDAKTEARAELARRLDYINDALACGDYLLGAQFSVVDAYAFNVIGWSRYVGIELAQWPRIVAYMERIAARPSVRESLVAEGLIKRAA